MIIWVFIWTLASPLTLASGVASLVLVWFDRTRPAGRILSATTVAVATGLTLLFGKAYALTRHSVTEPWDLFPPVQRAEAALMNGALALTGLALGVTATMLARHRVSRRTSLPPT